MVYTFSGVPDIVDMTVNPKTTPSVVPTSLSSAVTSKLLGMMAREVTEMKLLIEKLTGATNGPVDILQVA